MKNKTNKQYKDNIPFASDNIIVVTADLKVITEVDESITYHLVNPTTLMDGHYTPISDNPDKFSYNGPTFEIAKAEFWARWRMYAAQRFQGARVSVNIVNKSFINEAG